MIHVLIHASLDSLRLLPFLLLAYILIEALEEFATPRLSYRALTGKLAPLIGAGVGVIPQCGISVVAANLFAKKRLAMGTLLAVFISTSDEALPILISNPVGIKKILPLIGIKLVFAVIMGYAVNLFVKNRGLSDSDGSVGVVGCHHHEIGGEEKRERSFKSFILHPLVHTATVFAFLFAVNLLFALALHFVGEDRVSGFMRDMGLLQPAVAALVGLIPNCASSVIITQTYCLGQLGLGGAVAGLSVNAGLGMAVLFRQNSNMKENVLALTVLYASSVVVGTVIAAVQGLI